MSTVSKAVSIPGLSAAALVAVALLVPVPGLAQDKGQRGAGLGVGVNFGGIRADADATLGGGKGLVDANAELSVGGRDGVKADTRARVGGAESLVDADVDLSVGGSRGPDARVDATVGGDVLLDATIGAGPGGGETGATPGNPGDGTSGGSTGGVSAPEQRQILRQFSQLSGNERLQMIRRCRGINGGGYDVALANLCRLLETASR